MATSTLCRTLFLSSRPRPFRNANLGLYLALSTCSQRAKIIPEFPPSSIATSNSRIRRLSSTRHTSSEQVTKLKDVSDPSTVYHGPLTNTFRNLKVFSLTSFGLASAMTPFMFIIDSSLPMVARVALAATAILTSGVSTGLVAWCGRPYVASLRVLGDTGGIRMETTTLALRPRFTTVHDTAFLSETRRPFAKWELAESVRLQAPVPAGSEETVAETTDASGKVLGRWIVRWDEGGVTGTCREVGKVVRHFNVHEELLPVSIH